MGIVFSRQAGPRLSVSSIRHPRVKRYTIRSQPHTKCNPFFCARHVHSNVFFHSHLPPCPIQCCDGPEQYAERQTKGMMWLTFSLVVPKRTRWLTTALKRTYPLTRNPQHYLVVILRPRESWVGCKSSSQAFFDTVQRRRRYFTQQRG